MKKKLVLYHPLLSAQLAGGGGRSPLSFLKRKKSVLILEQIALFLCIYGLNSHLKCSFNGIFQKKHLNFSLQSLSFICRT